MAGVRTYMVKLYMPWPELYGMLSAPFAPKAAEILCSGSSL